MSKKLQLSTAGFAATAMSYGPARMGFGLFVPDFRDSFALSTPAVGAISGLGFLGFFGGLVAAQMLLDHRGPRAPVLCGLSAAAGGMALVSLAPGTGLLAAGVFLAGSSAGFAWTPFNDAVHRKVEAPDRPDALSWISTGTGAGVAAAAFAALAMPPLGLDWRVCWAGFALAAASALAVNAFVFRDIGKAEDRAADPGWEGLLTATARPLFAVAFVYGATSGVYIAFAGDHLKTAGGLPGVPGTAMPAVLFICYGLFGLAGFLTDRLARAIGVTAFLRALMLAAVASLSLLVLLPNSWFGVIPSAALQGLHVMMTSALLAFWSERLFPARPARGFTAALLATAVGSMLGPLAAGFASEAFGAEVMLAGTAALPALTAVSLRPRNVWHSFGAMPA